MTLVPPIRSYGSPSTPFDDGSQVEGLAVSSLSERIVAVALAGSDDGYLGNSGNAQYALSDDHGSTWSFGLGSPNPPSETADVIWSRTRRFFMAGAWDQAFWGGRPQGLFFSTLGQLWSYIETMTNATFDTAICETSSGTHTGDLIAGGELDSGTGKLIARDPISGPGSGTFAPISTPIDNQFFRVTQICFDSAHQTHVATLAPVGVVSSTERILQSSDGGVTWALRSSPLDGLAAYGCCYWASAGLIVATGQTNIMTSSDGGVTWTDQGAPGGGIHVGGKPSVDQFNNAVILPGGDTNDVCEWYGAFGVFGWQQLSGAVALKVALWTDLATNVVVIGGLGSPASAIWVSGFVPPVISNPVLSTRFDLG